MTHSDPDDIEDVEINRAPMLRISHIVRGRLNERNRVKYFVDPEGHDNERAIPEEVVLKRWRKRTSRGHSFHGFRLGPNTWRALAHAFGTSASKICRLTEDEIDLTRKSLKLDDEKKYLWLPSANSVWSMANVIGAQKLQLILDRHTDPDHAGRYGTPDLFLFATRTVDDQPVFYRMVEVKKPDEPASEDQKEEIRFLRSIGVPARILRLIER